MAAVAHCRFGSAVDAVLKIVKKARLAVDSDLARCLMAASLREPERLDTRALRKRFAVRQAQRRHRAHTVCLSEPRRRGWMYAPGGAK
jgi:hypothetical protein|eukprot:COSAG01_NODE_2486_length_7593_cov_2.425674_8_plen_88_part_00